MKLKGKITEPIVIAIAVLAFGVMMVFMSSDSGISDNTTAYTDFDEKEYREQLESRLGKLIEAIDGVGAVSVMITLEGSAVYNYATDVSQDLAGDDSKREATVVLSATGGGNKEAVICGYSLPDVKGVAVVCDGKLTPTLQSKVIGTVSSALGVATSKVYVTN